MRRLCVGIAAVAALLMTVSFTDRAEAAGAGHAASVRGAAENLAAVQQVHCIPGFRHHYPTEWRRADGCGRGGVIVYPRHHWYGWHRHHHHHHGHHHHHHHGHHHRHR